MANLLNSFYSTALSSIKKASFGTILTIIGGILLCFGGILLCFGGISLLALGAFFATVSINTIISEQQQQLQPEIQNQAELEAHSVVCQRGFLKEYYSKDFLLVVTGDL